MKFNFGKLQEVFGKEKVAEQVEESILNNKELVDVRFEDEAVKELQEAYDEFGGGEWEEEGFAYSDANEKGEVRINEDDVRETGYARSERDFDADGFIASIDEYDEENWAAQNDPEKARAMEDVIASEDDEYSQFDNIGLKEIIGKKKPLEDKEEFIPKMELPMGTDHFKRIQKAAEYTFFLKDKNVAESLAPKRGDTALSLDEINEAIKKFDAKSPLVREASNLERAFIENCKQYLWMMKRVNGGEPEKPREYEKLGAVPDKEGKMVSGDSTGRELQDAEIAELVQEYEDFKKNDPVGFALMRLEAEGEKRVADGEWKKRTFTWEKTNYFNTRTQKQDVSWACEVDGGTYISNKNPASISPEGRPADFFYEVRNVINKKDHDLIFIDLKLPPVKKIFEKTSLKKEPKTEKARTGATA